MILATLLFAAMSRLSDRAWVWSLAASFTLMIAGACLIIGAKRQGRAGGRFFTFGIKSVPARLARHYRWGWRLFLTGVLFVVWLLLTRQGVQ
jgi:hypothetical protein